MKEPAIVLFVVGFVAVAIVYVAPCIKQVQHNKDTQAYRPASPDAATKT